MIGFLDSRATCIALLLGATLLPSAGIAHDVWALHGSRVYTSPDEPPIDGGVVVVRDGKIIAVGAVDDVALPARARESDCGGVVTAGFQNSHVHFIEAAWRDARRQPASELAQKLKLMLTRYGFTTVADLASDLANTLALRRRVERREIPGPRILTAGWALFPHQGIPDYLEDMPPSFLQRLPQPATVAQAVADVDANIDQGADLIKLFTATPQAGAVIRYMPLAIARAAVDESHRRGRLVFAHPTDLQGLRTALAAGVDVLARTTIGDRDSHWDPALVRQMVAARTSLIPTLELWRYELAKAHLSEPVIEAATGNALEELHAFSAAGGQVLFGTDVGYMTDYDPTDEYALMARAGLSPMQILASLTTAPAARWKVSRRRGRIAPGMAADLVVLAADPAEDARNFAGVRCTFRNGQRLYP